MLSSAQGPEGEAGSSSTAGCVRGHAVGEVGFSPQVTWRVFSGVGSSQGQAQGQRDVLGGTREL